jgi:hypothetical protein
MKGTSHTKFFTINFVLTNRGSESCDPTDTATEMSVCQQDSIFGDSAGVEIWDKITFGNSDEGSEESGTE